MSSDKPTLDILDDIFSDVDPDETIVEIPAFQPAPTAPRSRTSRPRR
ncbi:hypothetical protein [Caldilinea sp.]|nr:hypothetical protein [Caldilinea sp.]